MPLETTPLASIGPAAGLIRRLPPRTVRLRLTALYGALFLASGAVLLAITYLLVRHATGHLFLFRLPGSRTGVPLPALARQAGDAAEHQHAAELHQLLVQSGVALAIMSVISIVLGWVVAGRVLRPLRTITEATHRISEHNLHERLSLTGPRDELRDLADTVDGLLGRLEATFATQKRFVANAAHELRTPLTLLRALLEETLRDPEATVDAFRATSRRLLALGEEQERLLDALLTLAWTERGIDRSEPFDLSVIADGLLMTPNLDAVRLGLDVKAEISPAPTTGDPALAERLIANLLENAVRYNKPAGWVSVRTGIEGGRAAITVTNTGPLVPTDEVDRLFEPFQRLATNRTSRPDGHHGLGLSIVRAIASAHHATLSARAEPGGGLIVRVGFPVSEGREAPVAAGRRVAPMSS